jgi:DNA invertase Pin-like site-specific DNA recombinase
MKTVGNSASADVAMFCPSVASMVCGKWFVRPEQPEWRRPSALAEKERAMIATRTMAALKAAKARGVILGGPKLAEARIRAVAINKASADAYAANVLPVIREIRRAGATSLHQIAKALNSRGITTPRGGQWYAKSVSNVLARA